MDNIVIVPTVAQVDAAADALVEHYWERMACLDHNRRCCPAGDAHDMSPEEAWWHMARLALEAAATEPE